MAELSFKEVLEKSLLEKLVSFANDEVVKFLRFCPDFFVMHPIVEPAKGTFFVICRPVEPMVFEKDEWECYRRYYPSGWMVVVWQDSLTQNLYCEKISNLEFKLLEEKIQVYASKPRPLEDFLNEILR